MDPKMLEEYLHLPYTTTLKRDEDGDVVARISELRGCVAHGADEVEALQNLKSMMTLWIESALEDGREIPRPTAEDEPVASGKWLQRTSRSIHSACIKAAAEEGVSLNQWVLIVLSKELGFKSGRSVGQTEVVQLLVDPSTSTIRQTLSLVAISKSWQVNSPEQGQPSDLDFITNWAGKIPLHFTEIGTASSDQDKHGKHQGWN